MIAIDAKGVTKTFGRIVAVDACDFTLEQGEVHVLLGTNGCGKSTFCKVVAGALPASAGEIRLFGEPIGFHGPIEARRNGIATVYQELSLNPTQSVADNIFLGQEIARFGLIDKRDMHKRTATLLAGLGDLGHGIRPTELVGDLSIDKKQIVEIAKALVLDPKIILFDESTSSLDQSQVKAFFSLVRRLKSEGLSIIFISHRMEEIFEIGDRVTVMRNGKDVGTRLLSDTNRETLVEMMVGEAEADYTRNRRQPFSRPADAAPLLSVTNLTAERLGPVSLDLYPGEVLGLGGLHGQGQSRLLLTLFGAIPGNSGEVSLSQGCRAGRSPRHSLINDIVYVSGDRGRDGSLQGRSILENLATSILQKNKGGVVHPAALKKAILPVVERLRLKYAGFGNDIGSLSGGNQQKVVIGRSLATQPLILLLDDPTKGIDVRTKADLFDLIAELRADGLAVILYSSEDVELLENADRILVFNSGRVSDSLEGERMNEFELYNAALKDQS